MLSRPARKKQVNERLGGCLKCALKRIQPLGSLRLRYSSSETGCPSDPFVYSVLTMVRFTRQRADSCPSSRQGHIN
jgi:hypothetical protein